MKYKATLLPYAATGYFSKIITDYLDNKSELLPFYEHCSNSKGMEDAMQARKKFAPHRKLLTEVLKEQYETVAGYEPVHNNIESLLNANTFTVCTAHQPAIFTGTLYFVYKILHTIRLAQELKHQFPLSNFVPVFWMGSEDADLDELGKIYLSADKLVWNTKQTGAVGRMNTKGLDKIMNRIEGELGVLPFGKELVQLLQQHYLNAPDIQTATFHLIHQLFGKYGLLVVLPDHKMLKKVMTSIFEEDLFLHKPSAIVAKTVQKLHDAGYKVQANPREINLFYLKQNLRNRIDRTGDRFTVNETNLLFSKEEIRNELLKHPDRFSPNVILRGLYQETILPNIAFIGGGGETAYWLELKSLFQQYQIPFPVLVLRNSFLIVEKKWHEKIVKTGFSVNDFFASEQHLLTALVKKKSNGKLQINNEVEEITQLYQQLKTQAVAIDRTLQHHVEALQAKALKPLLELEKKMLRAEKRKYMDEQRQLHAIKSTLFPLNGLQERIENFMPYYARWGSAFIDQLLQYSLTLEQQFVILQEG